MSRSNSNNSIGSIGRGFSHLRVAPADFSGFVHVSHGKSPAIVDEDEEDLLPMFDDALALEPGSEASEQKSRKRPVDEAEEGEEEEKKDKKKSKPESKNNEMMTRMMMNKFSNNFTASLVKIPPEFKSIEPFQDTYFSSNNILFFAIAKPFANRTLYLARRDTEAASSTPQTTVQELFGLITWLYFAFPHWPARHVTVMGAPFYNPGQAAIVGNVSIIYYTRHEKRLAVWGHDYSHRITTDQISERLKKCENRYQYCETIHTLSPFELADFLIRGGKIGSLLGPNVFIHPYVNKCKLLMAKHLYYKYAGIDEKDELNPWHFFSVFNALVILHKQLQGWENIANLDDNEPILSAVTLVNSIFHPDSPPPSDRLLRSAIDQRAVVHARLFAHLRGDVEFSEEELEWLKKDAAKKVRAVHDAEELLLQEREAYARMSRRDCSEAPPDFSKFTKQVQIYGQIEHHFGLPECIKFADGKPFVARPRQADPAQESMITNRYLFRANTVDDQNAGFVDSFVDSECSNRYLGVLRTQIHSAVQLFSRLDYPHHIEECQIIVDKLSDVLFPLGLNPAHPSVCRSYGANLTFADNLILTMLDDMRKENFGEYSPGTLKLLSMVIANGSGDQNSERTLVMIEGAPASAKSATIRRALNNYLPSSNTIHSVSTLGSQMGIPGIAPVVHEEDPFPTKEPKPVQVILAAGSKSAVGAPDNDNTIANTKNKASQIRERMSADKPTADGIFLPMKKRVVNIGMELSTSNSTFVPWCLVAHPAILTRFRTVGFTTIASNDDIQRSVTMRKVTQARTSESTAIAKFVSLLMLMYNINVSCFKPLPSTFNAIIINTLTRLLNNQDGVDVLSELFSLAYIHLNTVSETSHSYDLDEQRLSATFLEYLNNIKSDESIDRCEELFTFSRQRAEHRDQMKKQMELARLAKNVIDVWTAGLAPPSLNLESGKLLDLRESKYVADLIETYSLISAVMAVFSTNADGACYEPVDFARRAVNVFLARKNEFFQHVQKGYEHCWLFDERVTHTIYALLTLVICDYLSRNARIIPDHRNMFTIPGVFAANDTPTAKFNRLASKMSAIYPQAGSHSDISMYVLIFTIIFADGDSKHKLIPSSDFNNPDNTDLHVNAYLFRLANALERSISMSLGESSRPLHSLSVSHCIPMTDPISASEGSRVYVFGRRSQYRFGAEAKSDLAWQAEHFSHQTLFEEWSPISDSAEEDPSSSSNAFDSLASAYNRRFPLPDRRFLCEEKEGNKAEATANVLAGLENAAGKFEGLHIVPALKNPAPALAEEKKVVRQTRPVVFVRGGGDNAIIRSGSAPHDSLEAVISQFQNALDNPEIEKGHLRVVASALTTHSTYDQFRRWSANKVNNQHNPLLPIIRLLNEHIVAFFNKDDSVSKDWAKVCRAACTAMNTRIGLLHRSNRERTRKVNSISRQSRRDFTSHLVVMPLTSFGRILQRPDEKFTETADTLECSHQLFVPPVPASDKDTSFFRDEAGQAHLPISNALFKEGDNRLYPGVDLLHAEQECTLKQMIGSLQYPTHWAAADNLKQHQSYCSQIQAYVEALQPLTSFLDAKTVGDKLIFYRNNPIVDRYKATMVKLSCANVFDINQKPEGVISVEQLRLLFVDLLTTFLEFLLWRTTLSGVETNAARRNYICFMAETLRINWSNSVIEAFSELMASREVFDFAAIIARGRETAERWAADCICSSPRQRSRRLALFEGDQTYANKLRLNGKTFRQLHRSCFIPGLEDFPYTEPDRRALVEDTMGKELKPTDVPDAVFSEAAQPSAFAPAAIQPESPFTWSPQSDRE